MTQDDIAASLKNTFARVISSLAVVMLLCLYSGCGGSGERRYALVLDDAWRGACVDRDIFDAPSRSHWDAFKEICTAYERVFEHGKMRVTAELDPNRPYYDSRSPKYELKGQQELVFRLDTPDGPIPWQEVAVDTAACVRLKAYLRPGVSREEADLRRRLVNFQSLQRIVRGLEEGKIQKYRQVLNARRYVQALRNLAANSADHDLVRAYSTYADAIDARIVAGAMEKGFFFQADRRAFFAALPSMTPAQQEVIGSRIASESLKQLKSEPYPGLAIRYAEAMSRIRAMSFSNEPKAERQRLLSQYAATAAELLHKLIAPTSIDPVTAKRMLQLLEECLDDFVAVMPPKAEGNLKYYEARVGYEFASPECAQEFQTTGINVTLMSQFAEPTLTIPLKIVPNGREQQLPT